MPAEGFYKMLSKRSFYKCERPYCGKNSPAGLTRLLNLQQKLKENGEECNGIFFASGVFMLHQFIKYCIAICILPVAVSCSQINGGSLNETAKSSAPFHTTDTIFAGERDTTILVNNGEAFLKGLITAKRTKPRYKLPVWKGQIITARVKTIKKGSNLRINEVLDGIITEGPFGDNLEYKVKSNGNLVFVLGKSLTAGEAFTGDFIFHVLVK